jgi:putative DNA primase/helicase
LRCEWPDILRWAIEGCIDWQRNGLVRPSVVSAATATYFENQDLFGSWLDECCEVDGRNSETVKALFESYSAFADANGANPGKATTLSDELARRGLQRIKDTHGIRGRGFLGLKVRPTADRWGMHVPE